MDGLATLMQTTSQRRVGDNDEGHATVGIDKSTVADAVRHTLSLSPNIGDTGSARYRMERRLAEEVHEPLEQQLEKHERLRERLRDLVKWRQELEDNQREVAMLRKLLRSKSGSGEADLVTLSSGNQNSRVTCAEERMHASQAQVANISEEVLDQLLEVQENARRIVARPWSALARIRAEFFAGLAGHWAPVATALLGPAQPLSPALDSPQQEHGRDTGIGTAVPNGGLPELSMAHADVQVRCAAETETSPTSKE